VNLIAAVKVGRVGLQTRIFGHIMSAEGSERRNACAPRYVLLAVDPAVANTRRRSREVAGLRAVTIRIKRSVPTPTQIR
jgi:hypothetical protein